MFVACSRLTLAATQEPFKATYGGARGRPFDRKRFVADYVQGSCDCEASQQAPFWLEKAMLRRTAFHYCCPFCGVEHVMVDPVLMAQMGVTPR
jgi:hypothetical protein